MSNTTRLGTTITNVRTATRTTVRDTSIGSSDPLDSEHER
jgi:hypothetical protein